MKLKHLLAAEMVPLRVNDKNIQENLMATIAAQPNNSIPTLEDLWTLFQAQTESVRRAFIQRVLEAEEVKRKAREKRFEESFMRAVHDTTTLKACFMDHYLAWEEETAFMSSTSLIRDNVHFRAMVNMGMDAVPYIVEQLKKEPSHLCWVLTEIFGKPITTQPMSNTEVCKLWIEKLSA